MRRHSLRVVIFSHYLICMVFLLFMQIGIVHLYLYPRQAETVKRAAEQMVRIEADWLGSQVDATLTASELDWIAAELQLADGDALWLIDQNGAVLLERSTGDTPVEEGGQVEQALAGLVSGLTGEASGTLEVSMRERDILVYAHVPNTPGWKLCVLLGSDRILAQPREYALASWVIWGAMAALMTAATICLSGKIIKPLEQITRTIQEVGVDGGESKTRRYGITELDHLSKSISAMQLRIDGLFEKLVAEHEAKLTVERRMLQAQIIPHFLYNTLDNIAWRAMDCGDCQISDIINALSTFFRISLSDGREVITWDEEAEHVYSYLFIQQTRYEDKLDFDIDLDESIKDSHVIKLLLQPLVENALYHGIKQKEGRGSIQVRIRPEGPERVHVTVRDDGAGMSPERLACVREDIARGTRQSGFGLCTTAQRLRLTYGERCTFTVESEQGRGTVIDITVPWKS